MNNDLNKALRPIKKGFSFMFTTVGKSLPYLVQLCSMPLHGINYLIFKNQARNAGLSYDYNGSKITKASNWIGNQLAKIPNGIAKGISK